MHHNPTLRYHEASFLHSAHYLRELPPDTGQEIAILGRSNSGKSSFINKLLGKKLALVGQHPGKTKLLNSFALDRAAQQRIVDFPGYGFAKVSLSERALWAKRLEHYLAKRNSLLGVVLIMDIRHAFMRSDWEHVGLATSHHHPVLAVLNKADKCKARLQQTLLTQHTRTAGVPCQLFSAKTGQGQQAVCSHLAAWFHA